MYKRSLVLLVVAAVALFFYADLDHYLTLEALQANYQQLALLQADSPWWFGGAFFVLYVGVTALSLPGTTLLMLAGGALFGLGPATLLISFAASLGATLAFLLARYLLRESIQSRFSARLARINQGLSRHGVLYLLTLRLLPIVPSALVNLLMGLTNLPARTFYWVSQVGMLAAILIYVRAGTQLTTLQHPSELLSLQLFGPLVLLSGLPLLVNYGLKYRAYKKTLSSTTGRSV
ncbi:MAG: TVP38/TMEM64 family protein [Magnetococcales bacterium]|nr:TVP38/TMEM64 family protein [Magnetococcales bacterium]